MFSDKRYKLISATDQSGNLKFDGECYKENEIIDILYLQEGDKMIFAYEKEFTTVHTSRVQEIFANGNKLIVTTNNGVLVFKPI